MTGSRLSLEIHIRKLFGFVRHFYCAGKNSFRILLHFILSPPVTPVRPLSFYKILNLVRIGYLFALTVQNELSLPTNDKYRSVCELVYKPEARVDHLTCRSIKNVYEIARWSIEKFEKHVQNNQFGLLKFNLGYRTFDLNIPKGYRRKIFSAQTDTDSYY